MPGLRHQGATDDTAYHHGEHQGQIQNSGSNRASVVNRLEVQRQVVQQDDVAGGEEELKSRRLPNVTERKDTAREHGTLAIEELPDDESGPYQGAADEQADDSAAAPWLLLATIFGGKDKACES